MDIFISGIGEIVGKVVSVKERLEKTGTRMKEMNIPNRRLCGIWILDVFGGLVRMPDLILGLSVWFIRNGHDNSQRM